MNKNNNVVYLQKLRFLYTLIVKSQASDGKTPLGVQILKNFNVYPYGYWYWIGAAALVGFVAICNVGFTIALGYLNRKHLSFSP